MGFTVVGLLVVLAIVAVLARKQQGAAPAPGAAAPAGDVRGQGRQIQQQIRQQLDAAMQQPRPMPEDSQ
ncbi:hypothetical protein ACX12L_12595 [Alicycliphilus sp. T452]